MNLDYDRFYNEPTEFDFMMEEFKHSVLKSVKEEFIKEIEDLRAENARLWDIKTMDEEYKRKHRDKMIELDNEIIMARMKAKEERLSVIMKSLQHTMYVAREEYEDLPKCDKCDENRRIYYTTPLGREAYESCHCSERVIEYIPKECSLYSFRLNDNSKNVLAWYKLNKNFNEEWFEESFLNKEVYDSSMRFEDINRYKQLFATKEDCQKYCDWLKESKSK